MKQIIFLLFTSIIFFGCAGNQPSKNCYEEKGYLFCFQNMGKISNIKSKDQSLTDMDQKYLIINDSDIDIRIGAYIFEARSSVKGDGDTNAIKILLKNKKKIKENYKLKLVQHNIKKNVYFFKEFKK